MGLYFFDWDMFVEDVKYWIGELKIAAIFVLVVLVFYVPALLAKPHISKGWQDYLAGVGEKSQALPWHSR
jgi:hypothetical protein